MNTFERHDHTFLRISYLLRKVVRTVERSLKKFLKGFVFAFNGLVYVLTTQTNAVVHLFVATVVIAAGVFFRLSSVEFAILFLTISGVICTEVINTAVEDAVDHGSLQFDQFGRRAKDAAAGAVLLSGIFSVVVGVFILGPHLWNFLMKLI